MLVDDFDWIASGDLGSGWSLSLECFLDELWDGSILLEMLLVGSAVCLASKNIVDLILLLFALRFMHEWEWDLALWILGGVFNRFHGLFGFDYGQSVTLSFPPLLELHEICQLILSQILRHQKLTLKSLAIDFADANQSLLGPLQPCQNQFNLIEGNLPDSRFGERHVPLTLDYSENIEEVEGGFRGEEIEVVCHCACFYCFRDIGYLFSKKLEW